MHCGASPQGAKNLYSISRTALRVSLNPGGGLHLVAVNFRPLGSPSNVVSAILYVHVVNL